MNADKYLYRIRPRDKELQPRIHSAPRKHFNSRGRALEFLSKPEGADAREILCYGRKVSDEHKEKLIEAAKLSAWLKQSEDSILARKKTKILNL